MQKTLKPILIAFTVNALLSGSSFASLRATCEEIDAAISATEDFVEISLSSDKGEKRESARTTVHETFTRIERSLTPETIAENKKAISKLDQTFAANMMAEASLEAMKSYALLVNGFEEQLPTTLDIAMLDHAGFKLNALLATTTIDWSDVIATQSSAKAHIAIARQQLKDRSLSDLLASIEIGLEQAVAAKNKAWTLHSAQLLLDSVDLMERSVKNPSKLACR